MDGKLGVAELKHGAAGAGAGAGAGGNAAGKQKFPKTKGGSKGKGKGNVKGNANGGGSGGGGGPDIGPVQMFYTYTNAALLFEAFPNATTLVFAPDDVIYQKLVSGIIPYCCVTALFIYCTTSLLDVCRY